jgi:hypothetical protein
MVVENLSQKYPTQNRAGGVAQVVKCLTSPEFKSQYCPKQNKTKPKKKKRNTNNGREHRVLRSELLNMPFFFQEAHLCV